MVAKRSVLEALGAVALTTVLVYPLRPVAADIALSVLYLPSVLFIAWRWGTAMAVGTAIAAALAFGFSHVQPAGRLEIAEGENWVALVVFLVAAIAAGALADVARSRSREAELRRGEADLAAEMARILLRGGDLAGALPVAAGRLSDALGLPGTRITLEAVDHPVSFPLQEGERRLGTLVVDPSVPEPVLRRLRARVVPALEAMLAAALEREALLSDVVETRALRRSDVLKTALLRAVSHDLRTPLTGIVAAAEPLGAERLDDDDRRELAAGVAQDAQRLSRLIDQLLDLSRLEARAVETRPDWCSIDEVLRGAAEHVATPTGLKLSLDADLPLVRADAAQLERAFANLLENSARHAGGHPVSVRARVVGTGSWCGSSTAARESRPPSSSASSSPSIARAMPATARVSASRSPGASSRSTARASGPSRRRARGRRSSSSCRSSPSRRPCARDASARASSSATTSRRSCARCASRCATRASTSWRRPGRRRPSTPPRCSRRTPRSSTSCSPTATGSP